jgi:hypothetical protein
METISFEFHYYSGQTPDNTPILDVPRGVTGGSARGKGLDGWALPTDEIRHDRELENIDTRKRWPPPWNV